MVSDGKQAVIPSVGNGVGISDFIQFFLRANFGIDESKVSKMLLPFGSVIPALKNDVQGKDIHHSFVAARKWKLYK